MNRLFSSVKSLAISDQKFGLVRHFVRHFLYLVFARFSLGGKKLADKRLKQSARRFLLNTILNTTIWRLSEKVADKDAAAQNPATF